MRTALAVGLGLAWLVGCQRSQPEPQPQVERDEAAPTPTPTPTSDAPDDEQAAHKQTCTLELSEQLGPRFDDLAAPLCAEWIERKLPGVALAIVEPGAEPIHVELGVRCFSDEAKVGPKTLFRIGSISKTLTAAIVLGAIDEGRLARDSSVGMLPGFVDQEGTPTPSVAGLLRHRSGLGDIEPEQLVDHDGAWLPALAKSASAGEVGEFHYSNTGYSLLGALAAHVLERPYDGLIDDRIAAPLELEALTARVDPLPPGAACGHLEYDLDRHPIRVDEDLDFMPGDPDWMNPAGGLVASASDLSRFALALGDALPGTAAMLEPGEPAPEARRADERYGDGIRSWKLSDGTRAYGHSGNNVAFAAELIFVPGRRAIALLTNCGAGMPASLVAAERLLQLP